MLDLFNIPTPQNCNFQEFLYRGTTTTGRSERWIKPRGCSMVRFLLIGAGGGGGNGGASGGFNGASGGGSGAITSLIIPAMFVPDSVIVQVGAGGAGGAAGTGRTGGSSGQATTIYGLFTSSTAVNLLTASAGGGGDTSAGSAGTVFSNNYFSAAGILTAIAGQAGALKDTSVTATSTIPLTGGAGGSTTTSGTAGGTVTPNYGYPVVNSSTTDNADNGYYQLSPLLLGAGGAGGGYAASGSGLHGGNGGIGCGGGGGGRQSTGGRGGNGGNGAVYIWSW